MFSIGIFDLEKEDQCHEVRLDRLRRWMALCTKDQGHEVRLGRLRRWMALWTTYDILQNGGFIL